jgi:thioester reductase-like protein
MVAFVTGASGFIGKRLVARLLERGPVYFLVHPRSLGKLEALYRRWGVERSRAVPVVGDLTAPGLGIGPDDARTLKGRVRHFFHLAAVYDLAASAEAQIAANVEGTRHAVWFATEIEAGRFHHMSSIAAAGLYEGTFTEDMFEEAENLEHPYFSTKHEAERIVRTECALPWRIYRPGIVVGQSDTGEMDKIDGPYYFFKAIQKLRNLLPRWFPAVGLEGGRLNLVPVDFVVRALDELAHRDGLDGRCFHLTDPEPKRVGEILDIFARAGHAPELVLRLNPRLLDLVPETVRQALALLTPIHRLQGRAAARPRAAARSDALRELSHALRQPRDAQAAGRSRHPRAAARGLRVEAVGLLGAAPRPRPARRAQPGRRGARQSGAGHRRGRRHRQGHRAEGRGRRRHGGDRRPGRREA